MLNFLVEMGDENGGCMARIKTANRKLTPAAAWQVLRRANAKLGRLVAEGSMQDGDYVYQIYCNGKLIFDYWNGFKIYSARLNEYGDKRGRF